MLIRYGMDQLLDFLVEKQLTGKGFLNPIIDERHLNWLLRREKSTPLDARIGHTIMSYGMSVDTTTEECYSVINAVQRFFSDSRQLDDVEVGDKICAFGVLTGIINHSCQPNTEIFLLEDYDAPDLRLEEHGRYGVRFRRLKILLQATRHIRKGEEITITYGDLLSHESREDWLRHIKETYGFDCHCSACLREEESYGLLRLKDDVLRLYKEIEDFDYMAPTEVYRRAAYILDGFAELELDHAPIIDVWDVCSETAWQHNDMIRAYWFSWKGLEHARSMYGDPVGPLRSRMVEARRRLDRIAKGKGPNQFNSEGHSAVPDGGFDIHQDGLEALMFGLNHDIDDDCYHTLQVVDGSVREISRDEIKRQLAQVQANQDKIEWQAAKEAEAAAREHASQKRLREMTPEEIARELQDESDAAKPNKKKSKKRKSKVQPDTEELPGPEIFESPGPVIPTFDDVPMTMDVIEDQVVSDSPDPEVFEFQVPLRLNYPFVSSFGDLEGTSRQVWLADVATREAVRVNCPRDIGHLLAAKDGYAINNEGYVLSTRRDSVCGRIEGRRALWELRGVASRRARTHSFGCNLGRIDMLKLADVRESVVY